MHSLVSPCRFHRTARRPGSAPKNWGLAAVIALRYSGPCAVFDGTVGSIGPVSACAYRCYSQRGPVASQRHEASTGNRSEPGCGTTSLALRSRYRQAPPSKLGQAVLTYRPAVCGASGEVSRVTNAPESVSARDPAPAFADGHNQYERHSPTICIKSFRLAVLLLLRIPADERSSPGDGGAPTSTVVCSASETRTAILLGYPQVRDPSRRPTPSSIVSEVFVAGSWPLGINSVLTFWTGMCPPVSGVGALDGQTS